MSENGQDSTEHENESNEYYDLPLYIDGGATIKQVAGIIDRLDGLYVCINWLTVEISPEDIYFEVQFPSKNESALKDLIDSEPLLHVEMKVLSDWACEMDMDMV